MAFTFIDLFAGAGGLSEGFFRQNFVDIAHLEMNERACRTLKTRCSYHFCDKYGKKDIYNQRLINGDNEYSAMDLWNNVPKKVTNKVICDEMRADNFDVLSSKIAGLNKEGRIDVIIGGPPCQAYSLVGRSRSPNRMEDDPRNFLYKIYFKYIERFQPKIFVFENVTGIESAGGGKYLKDITQEAEKLGYKIQKNIVLARTFGVLQNRKRVIIMGAKSEELLKSVIDKFEKIKTKKNREFEGFMVSDLLSDLPSINMDEGLENNIYRSGPTPYLIQSKIRPENSPYQLSQNLTRRINEHDRKIYRVAIEKWANKERLDYTKLPPELITFNNLNCFTDKFKVVAGDQPASQTMMAHISKDGHYYIHPDINQLRSLTVREAARIQSFPDDYFFEGGRTAAFAQIGNAVPPLLSEAIATAIKGALKEDDRRKNHE